MALVPGDIIVISVTPSIIFGDRGQSVAMTAAQFTVRGHGPFTVEMETAKYSAQVMRSLIYARAEELVATLEIT